MNKELFLTLLYFVGFLAMAALAVVLLKPFLSSLAWAAVLALAARPLHRKFLSWCKGRENLSAFLSTAVVVLVLVLPLLVLAVLFAGEATQVVIALEGYASTGQIPGVEAVLANPRVQSFLDWAQPYVKDLDLKPLALAAMKTVSTVAIALSKAAFKNLFAALLKFFVMVAILFFAFRDGDRIALAFWDVIPLKRCDKDLIASAVRRVVYAVLYGIILTCVVQGALGGVGFALVGLPSPVFFGAVMVVFAFIPVVGTALVWVPGALYLFAAGHTGKAVFLLLWSAAVVSSIDNVIRPYFISNRSKLPLLVILLGVLGGMASMGFLGILVGPLFFAVALEVFRVYRTDIFPRLKELQSGADEPCPPGEGSL
ncbi:MAG: AI-2E family transporter [Acidobacteriota bacterium]